VEQVHINIGHELSRQREAKGLTVSQIADELKISQEFIEKLEKGCFDFLPPVYIRGFLQTYARRIGLNPAILLQSLSSGQQKPDLPVEKNEPVIAPERSATKERLNKLKDRPGWILFIALFLLLIFLYFQKTRPPVVEMSDTGLSLKDSTRSRPEEGYISAYVEETERLTLTVTAVDTTWVRIVFDDSVADEGIFAPGDRRTWQSDERFFLRLGNAGGLLLSLDGQNLGTPGQVGAISNIVVNRDGFAQIPYSELPPAIFPEHR
jgi:cytoskeleton protein RodZ